MSLGFAVAFGLSLLDAAFSVSLRKFGTVFLRVVAGGFVGLFGGLFGGFIGGTLYWLKGLGLFFILGWTIVGFLIGASIPFFEIFQSLLSGKDLASAFRKLVKCLVGGAIGGLLGGLIALGLGVAAAAVTSDAESLWSPTGFGFVAIGACIGLLVGLAQVILKEAWLKVEAGFRPGRELLISKEKTSIGRGEGADVALFGDAGVEKTHAHIVLDGGRYYLEDQHTPGGTFVNEQKVNGRFALKAGDLIRVGKSMLRFNERAKRKD